MADRVCVALITPWCDFGVKAVEAAARRGEVDTVGPWQAQFVVDLLRATALLRAMYLEVGAAALAGPSRPMHASAGGKGSGELRRAPRRWPCTQ